MADNSLSVDYLLHHRYSWEDQAEIDEQFNVEYCLWYGVSWEKSELISDESHHTESSWIEKLRDGTAFAQYESSQGHVQANLGQIRQILGPLFRAQFEGKYHWI